MKRGLRILLAVVIAAAAAWWLFWLTPSRGGRQADTIRFGFWGDYQEYRMWRRIIDRFGREHPEVHVTIEYVPGSGEYGRKLTAWLASGSGPDVMLLQDEPFPRYVHRRPGRPGVLVDLTEMIAGRRFGEDLTVRQGDYDPIAWASFGQDEPSGRRQYGLPVFGGNNLIFYNRQCFRRAGVALPEATGIDAAWTTEEFLDLCKRLTIRRDIDGRTRTEQWGFDRPHGWLYWLPFTYACDARILSDDRQRFAFTGDGALKSLQLWDDLRVHGVVPGGGDLGSMRQNVAFLTGKVAMVCQGPWAMPFFNEAKLDYGVMFPPFSATGRRGTRVTWDCVALAGRLRDDPARLKTAYTFARFVASAAAAEIVAETQRSIPAHREGVAAFVAGSDATRGAKFVEAMAFARAQPITLKWSDMDEGLRASLGRLTRGALTPAETLTDMADRVGPLFDGSPPGGRP